MRIRSSCFTVASVVFAMAGTAASVSRAIAVEAPKAAAPVPSDPGTTTASFGDWVLTCQRLPEGSKPARVCEVDQSIRVQGQQAPFARIAIGRLASNQSLAVTVVLPNDIRLPSVVHVGTDAKDKGPDLNWTRCLPGGCFAEAPLSPETVQHWRATTQASKVSFEDAAGREIGFPISFRGLPQALDALTKEF